MAVLTTFLASLGRLLTVVGKVSAAVLLATFLSGIRGFFAVISEVPAAALAAFLPGF